MKYSKYLWVVCLFCLTPAMAFKTLYPKNNLTIGQNPIQFAWSATISPFPEYNLVISGNPDLSNPIINANYTVTTASVFIPDASNNTMYYWSVTDKSLNLHTSIMAFKYVIVDSIAALAAWYRADSGAITNSGKVTQWSDLSGNTKDLSQSTMAAQPTYISQESILNNKPVIQFTGTPNNYLQSASDLALTDFSVFILRNYEAYSPSPPLQYFLGGTAQGLFSEGLAINAGFGTFTNGVASYSSINSLTPQFAVYLHDNKHIRINNSANIGQTVNFSSITLNTLGARADALGFAYKGKMAEIIIYGAQLDDDKSLLVYNYLYDKYAPPLNLGDDIIAGSSFCDSVTINAEDRFTNYLWTSGQTTSSVKVTANGKYGLSVKDIFDRSSYDEINVYPYPRLNNSTIYICQGDTFTVDLKTPVGFTALWNTGATTTKLKVFQGGQYTVKITDPQGCFVFDTLNVAIDNPSLNPNPTGGMLTLCENEKLFATTQTTFDSIHWSTGSSNTFITVSTPGAYSIYARTSLGCVLNQNFNVTIAGKAPIANFITSAACDSVATLFTDVSSPPAPPPAVSINSWLLTFGDGQTSALQTPSNIYSALGSYTASLKVTTTAGCSDSIAKTIVVKKRPKANFTNLLSCSGIATTFVDQSLANADSIQSWSWNFAGLGTSTQKNPKFEYPAPSVYNTFLQVINSNGCKDTITKPTTVNPSPIAEFKADSACLGTNTIFVNQSTVTPPSQITGYNWDYGDGTQSIQPNQPHLYDAYGIYTVQLAIRSSNQCLDTVEHQVQVFANPNVDFSISNTQCTGKEIQFTDASSTPDGSPLTKWNWFFSGQGNSTLQNPKFTFNTQGNYTIQLTAQTAIGCVGSKFRSIAITSPPTVNFSFSPSYGPPPLNVTYTNTSPNTTNFIWDYGDGTPTFNGFNAPPHTYTVRGTYPIKLVATDFKGCSDSLVKNILVDQAVVDGVMVSVSIIADGDYYKVYATILNNSNIEITSLGLTIKLENGSEVKEVWTGVLLPGNTIVYPFTGELKYNAAGDVPVICATIESVNVNAVESNQGNNSTCKEITVGPFDVLSVYPNPTTDNVNFGVMLPSDGAVEITLYDLLGHLLYGIQFGGTTGYNNFNVPVSVLNASVYVAEIKYNGSVIHRKVMREDRHN